MPTNRDQPSRHIENPSKTAKKTRFRQSHDEVWNPVGRGCSRLGANPDTTTSVSKETIGKISHLDRRTLRIVTFNPPG
ncbi:hypothetical protein BM221_006714 [Beauveria bassiana]|uniref:Uncharacterized protein n=1 Tax=Beauveria bassiana TaxID=176275 RepID=A0A2N6NIF5_BEABA|nr:hypothetical protein BM221_006714 [Beauveria bassiana]